MNKISAFKMNNICKYSQLFSGMASMSKFQRLESHTTDPTVESKSIKFDPEYQQMVNMYYKDKLVNDADNNSPNLPGPTDCCGEGCQNCVWLEYVIKVKFHSVNNEQKIQEAIDCIPDSDVRAFVAFELQKMK